MDFTDKVLFHSVENWAAAAAKGFVIGRLPLEDSMRSLEIVSKLTWKTPPGIPGPIVPLFREIDKQSIPEASAVTAGSWNRAVSLPIPDTLAKLLHIPIFDSSAKHAAKILSVNSNERVDITDIPTCTTKGVFNKQDPGKFPPHPSLKFSHPVGRVHVQVNDNSKRYLWDAIYDLKGGKVLGDSSELITAESPVPGFIPPCSISSKSFLNMTIDAELAKASPETLVLNPVGTSAEEAANILTSQPLPVDRPVGHHDSQTTDAIICKIQKGLKSAQPIIVHKQRNKEDDVYLPPEYRKALWQIDRGNEEASDLNPRGTPMHEMVDSSDHPPPGLSPQMKELGPISIGSGQFIPRRPTMNGEILITQLEKGNFAKIFDSSSLEKNPYVADPSVTLQRPAGNHQPTVDRTLFSGMWQGIHHKHTPLHPSVEFKHPATYARLQLIDIAKKKLVWDAVFDVKGNHKIAVDQKPVGGSVPEFAGVTTSPPGKAHWYILRVDADNPKDNPTGSHDPIRFWRQAQFVFGTKRPFVHADAIVEVTNSSRFAQGAQIIKS